MQQKQADPQSALHFIREARVTDFDKRFELKLFLHCAIVSAHLRKGVNSMTKNMTEGSPMKLILGFSIPLLVGYLFQQFYSIVDTIIVGKYLGIESFAAVAAAVLPFLLPINSVPGIMWDLENLWQIPYIFPYFSRC